MTEVSVETCFANLEVLSFSLKYLLQFIITQIIKYNVAKLLEVNKQTLLIRWILSSVFQPWTKLPRNFRKSENSSLLR